MLFHLDFLLWKLLLVQRWKVERVIVLFVYFCFVFLCYYFKIVFLRGPGGKEWNERTIFIKCLIFDTPSTYSNFGLECIWFRYGMNIWVLFDTHHFDNGLVYLINASGDTNIFQLRRRTHTSQNNGNLSRQEKVTKHTAEL